MMMMMTMMMMITMLMMKIFFKRFFMIIIVEASLELKEVFSSFFSIYSGYGKSRPACTEASPQSIIVSLFPRLLIFLMLLPILFKMS